MLLLLQLFLLLLLLLLLPALFLILQRFKGQLLMLPTYARTARLAASLSYSPRSVVSYLVLPTNLAKFIAAPLPNVVLNIWFTTKPSWWRRSTALTCIATVVAACLQLLLLFFLSLHASFSMQVHSAGLNGSRQVDCHTRLPTNIYTHIHIYVATHERTTLHHLPSSSYGAG